MPLLQAIAKHGGTVNVVKQAGQKGVTKWLDDATIRFHKATIERVIVWAANATEPDPMAVAVSVLTSCPREMRKVVSISMALCRELNVG